MGCHLIHIDREIGVGHLFFNGALQAARAIRGVEKKMAFAVGVKGREKWNALDVVPVEMREKDVRGNGSSVGFLHELLAEIAKAGSAIKHVDVVIQANLDARGIDRKSTRLNSSH